ncbi:MAG TPA: hypothetical protein VFK52_11170 [Nocardioidaceae bacterium]|nr:hypothetical protein [Nocardioidaceae bacterium]
MSDWVELRSPDELANWTLPVLEVSVVLAAFAMLVAAVRDHRRGDSTPLGLWIAAVVYLLVIEPPLYFPEKFGIDEYVDVLFTHNVFMVQFMDDRLPLYIVALYPALASLAYRVVRALGVFEARGLLAGAVTVGWVHLCFYEVFDQVGPQLRWWSWNLTSEQNQPFLASVPLPSIVIFAAVGPLTLVLLVSRFKGVRGAVLAGALTPLGLVVANLPSALLGTVMSTVDRQRVVLIAELAIFAGVGSLVLVRQLRRPHHQDRVALAVGSGFLAVHALFWVTAHATESSTPVGSLPFTAACFGIAVLVLAPLVLALSQIRQQGRNRAPTLAG